MKSNAAEIENDENETETETLIDDWETSGALAIELHDCDDHYELIATELDEEADEDEQSAVTLAFSLEELDEVIKILGEARAAMERRARN